MKSFLKQTIMALIVIAATIALWIAYVPSAQPWLERAGVYTMLGIAPPAKEEAAPQRRGGGATRVIVAPVQEMMMNDRVTAIGDGRALRAVTLRSEVTGRITALNVDTERHVRAGDVLFRLDDEAEQIAVERARLMLENARGEYERAQQLKGSGAVTAVRLREVELALRTAELATRQAEFDLAQREIRAPISGTIGLIEVETGDRITTQDALAVITDRSQILIDFRVTERVIGQLAVGMPLTATALAQPDLVLTGDVSAIDNVVDRNSRTLRVQGRLNNEGDTLRDGMAFSVALAFPGQTFPAVEPLAVQWSSDGSFVWVVRDGKAARVPVAIRQRNADTVLVEGALTTGDLVVTEGVQNLRPGAEVTPANQPEASAPANSQAADDAARKL